MTNEPKDLVIRNQINMKEQDWFEMHNTRRRQISNAVWIPIRSAQTLQSVGCSGYEGYREEIFCTGSVMLPLESHECALKLSWDDIGIANQFSGGEETIYSSVNDHSSGESEERDAVTKYIPCGDYWDNRSGVFGVGPVIEQHINSQLASVWHLHQDFVVALNLIQEGDKWVRPNEGHVEVARLSRNSKGEPVLLEVRAEHLSDYLRARKMNLYVSSYRSRTEIVTDKSHINWASNPHIEEAEMQRWEGQVNKIHEGGMPFGTTAAVIHVARTDVDEEEDVPDFGIPTGDNVKYQSRTMTSEGRPLYRISGELWRLEIIPAGVTSERVLKEEPPSSVGSFIVDSAGRKETKETLVGGIRWLWFKPGVINDILSRRGSLLRWFTQDTGKIGLAPDYGVHFGVNSLGFINVFAKDIALLPEWQQRVWVGFNVTPEGKVSTELLASQVRASPASTIAPEEFLRDVYLYLKSASVGPLGKSLFRQHEQADELLVKCHRFRAIDRSGLFELAKDVARLTIEDIDLSALSTIIEPPKNEKWGSIRHLEEALKEYMDASEAKQIVSSIHGLNRLRQADAHLRSKGLTQPIERAGIYNTGIPIHEARQMLQKHAETLHKISAVLCNTKLGDNNAR